MAKGKVRGSDGEEPTDNRVVIVGHDVTVDPPLGDVAPGVTHTGGYTITPVYGVAPMKPLWSDVSVVQRGKGS